MYGFFFQAEDGIRDIGVTGVQTCALPISIDRLRQRTHGTAIDQSRNLCPGDARLMSPAPHRRRRRTTDSAANEPRSEERRVGKECRSRWWPDKSKKNRKRTEES